MSTSGNFNPPDDPCDETIHTATALVALRNSGGLRVGCHYRVQGPVIGTPGNTSATVLELHAVTASSLSKEAKVFQSFNPEGAFVGNYDPDADTANGGTLNRLVDHWGNEITDEDVAAPTVHTQFPYHLSGPNLRDNQVNDSVLAGVTAGVSFVDNMIRNTTVDLSGQTSGAFERNEIIGGSLTSAVPTAFIRDNQLSASTVSHAGTAAGSFSFQGNAMLSGSVTVDAATTAQVTVNNNVVGGTSGGYRISVVGKTSGTAIVSGNRLFNASVGSFDMQLGGTEDVTVTSNEIGAGAMRLDGLGDTEVRGNSLSNVSVSHLGTGPFQLVTTTAGGWSLTLAAPSTRGLTVAGVLANGASLTQNGTGSANVDTFQAGTGNTFQSATVTLNATSATTPATTVSGLVATNGAVIGIGDHTAAAPVNNVRVDSAATLNVGGAGSLGQSRLSCLAVLNCQEVVSASVIEGQITKTAAVAQSNRYASAAFDNWV